MRRIPWRITIPIRVIRRRTLRRAILHPRRLRILPHRRIRYATVRHRRRLRRHAPRRWRTKIIEDPIHQLAIMHVVANIVRRPYVFVRFVRNSRAINSRPIPRAAQLIRPSPQISMKRRRQPPAVLNIQENHRISRKPFRLRPLRRGLRIDHGLLLCRSVLLHFVQRTRPIQRSKSEAERLHQLALALPRIDLFSRRRPKPESRIRKRLPQNRQRIVAGINIPIESEKGPLLRRRHTRTSRRISRSSHTGRSGRTGHSLTPRTVM